MVHPSSCPYGCNPGNTMYTIYPGHRFRERYVPYLGQSKTVPKENMCDQSGNPLYESQPPDVDREMLWCIECRKTFVLEWREVESDTMITRKCWQMFIKEVSALGQ